MTASVNRHTPTTFTPRPLQTPAARSSLRLQSRSAEVKSIKDSSCYDTIIAKYPGMDSASKAIVKVLCDDQENVLNPGKVQLSNVGIEAIGDALQQNSNLKDLKINEVDCLDQNCLIKLGSVFGNALKVNRGLQSLEIAFSNSSQATKAFISNLNCFNLNLLIINGGVLDPSGAEIFSNVFSQKCPLLHFDSTSTVIGGANTIASIANGIGKNSCLISLGFYLLPGIKNLDEITTLFEGIGNSKIWYFYVPQLTTTTNYSFNDAQKMAILEAVKSNSCFLNYFTSEYPFPSDLDAAIQNMTQDRTPCTPDPACEIAQICLTPSPPPAPIIPTSSVQVGLVIGIGSILAVALATLGILSVKKCREGAHEERRHLIQ